MQGATDSRYLTALPRELEIRKLPPQALFGLVQILESDDGWKHLMAVVPKTECAISDMKYSMEHFKLIEHAAILQKRPSAEIFLEEWGTSGQRRPTLGLLLELLVKSQLFRCAEYVAVDLLKDTLPERPNTGPAAVINLTRESFMRPPRAVHKNEGLSSIESVLAETHLIGADKSENHRNEGESSQMTNGENNEVNSSSTKPELHTSLNLEVSSDSSYVTSQNQITTSLPHYTYTYLAAVTNDFSDYPLKHDGEDGIGRKIGTGAFGTVYLGTCMSKKVAVKKLHKDAINVEKQFLNEVDTLSRFQHKNLLPLLGYSCNGPNYCLIYEYMSNGSLQERLSCRESTPILTWRTRLDIALGTAEGILYLHTACDKPLVHRDIKSANILLDDNLTPKLGDFGLVHLGSGSQQSQSLLLTSTVFGTSAYMAPEAFRGDISVKLDTFSYGVVLLELLTSLSPYDESREGCDLITHVEDICDGSIEPLLDKKAGTWETESRDQNPNIKVSELIYNIALKCLEEKRSRPSMETVTKMMEEITRMCI